jgi:hypothetical protein
MLGSITPRHCLNENSFRKRVNKMLNNYKTQMALTEIICEKREALAKKLREEGLTPDEGREFELLSADMANASTELYKSMDSVLSELNQEMSHLENQLKECRRFSYLQSLLIHFYLQERGLMDDYLNWTTQDLLSRYEVSIPVELR